MSNRRFQLTDPAATTFFNILRYLHESTTLIYEIHISLKVSGEKSHWIWHKFLISGD